MLSIYNLFKMLMYGIEKLFRSVTMNFFVFRVIHDSRGCLPGV